MKILGHFQSLWIKFRCLWITAICSSGALLSVLQRRGKLDPKAIDQQLLHWSGRLSNTIATELSVINHGQIDFNDGKRYIIMANHASLFDIPLTFLALPKVRIRMLAKNELSYIPIFGMAMRKAQFPFIHRQNRQQAIQDLEAARLLMENHGVVLWIAPEGRRSNDGNLQPFKKGGFIAAIQSKAIIVPLAIQGAFHILSRQPGRITQHQPVTITLGKPIDCTHYQLSQKDELKELTRNALQQLLQNPSE